MNQRGVHCSAAPGHTESGHSPGTFSGIGPMHFERPIRRESGIHSLCQCAARRKTAADGTKDTPMGRGAAAAAPHDVLIWAAPHPRRIFCDPAAQGLWICHCEAPTGPWRPEREARGSALGVQSREGTRSLYRPPLKWYAPITSVAALTAQPLAALPPYGCGVPFTGVERLV